MFNPPANEDDLADLPQQKDDLIKLWNSKDFMGGYVSRAAKSSPNYVDPRDETPVGDPVKVPWNGFPRLLSRWFDDENSDENKVAAEKVAEILTPIVSWVLPEKNDSGVLEPTLFHAELHRLPYYISLRPEIEEVARPLFKILPDGSLGEESPRFRRQQDEYLEWHPSFDEEGRLSKLTFTAEPPDYWTALAQISKDRVVKLYNDYLVNDDSIAEEDLFHQNDLAAFGRGLDGELRLSLIHI